MPDIIFTMTQQQLSRLISATCVAGGYSATIESPQTGEQIPNPESDSSFAKRYWRERMIDIVKTTELHTQTVQNEAEHTPLVVT